MAAHTVPIYWGNRYVDQEFNKDAFIDVSDFDSVDRAIEYIRKVDSDDELYMKILNAPKLAVDAPVDWNDRLQAFLDHIVKNGRHYICQYGYSRKMYEERKIKERLVNVRILRGFARRFLK